MLATRVPAALAVLVGLFCLSGFAQTGTKEKPAGAESVNVGETESASVQQPIAAPAPAAPSVRDIELGMSVDDVKAKLGKPEVTDDTGMYFTLSGGDSVQIGLDENKKVRTVAAVYAAGSKLAPSPDEVLGDAVEKTDGDMYKMVRYPDKGYWVSYSRSGSDKKPLVVVTLRKIF